MAVYYTGGGGGILGGLGTILGIGGALTNNPWFKALGMGANAFSGGGSSGGDTTGGALDMISQIANQMGWTNPSTGNVASQNPELDKLQAANDEEWARQFLKNRSGLGGYWS